mmetsp:Transcript_4593/g.13968  ORF Transcript_4593/g.13968 Transcript_4593/m.13968 type:complete len:99 (-) Transcript_4593:127-423(-)
MRAVLLLAATGLAFQHGALPVHKTVVPSCEEIIDSEGWFCAEDDVMTMVDGMNCLVTGECRVPRRFERQDRKLGRQQESHLPQRTMQVFDSEDTFEVA